MDYLRARSLHWNVVQQQTKEQTAFNLNKNLFNIIIERDAAVEERNKALLEKKAALEERQLAIKQRNLAVRERNNAFIERDNAVIALQQSMIQPVGHEIQRGIERLACGPGNCTHEANADFLASDMLILNALCKTLVTPESNTSPQPKKKGENRQFNCAVMEPRKRKHKGDQSNLSDSDSQNLGLNRVHFDGSIMPVPVCSCTGVFRNCYKWGKGGWQSSCCTTSISAFPLPPVPSRRYGRMGGRKMTGGAFSKLLSRLALEGFDFSRPVDLKDHWSRHGTNRYITIK